MCLVSSRWAWCMGPSGVGGVVGAVCACVLVGSAVDGLWFAIGGI
jgi:hypothetical protein